MVTRVGKFLGGLGADVTSVANVHASQNRIALGGDENPSANAHVIGTLLATTNTIVGATAVTSGHTLDVRGTANTGAITATTIALSADGGVQVPNDGNIGSAGATDAMQISSGGIVTFKDDIKLKDDGTIGSASAAAAMTIDSSGIVTFVDDIKIKDGGTIGSASDAAAMTIAATGQVTFSDVATFSGGLKVPDDGDIGSASATDAMQISSAGIVTFKDDIILKDAGTIGSATTPAAVTIANDGKATLADDLAVTGNITSTLQTVVTTGLGVAGNSAPSATAISLGTPANVILRTHAASGVANLIMGDATATSGYSIDVRGSANVGAFTTSGMAFPTSDGTEDYVLQTDGSGTLSWAEQSAGAVDPATTLASDLDCGTASDSGVDAFGIAISALTELDLSTEKKNGLGTVDLGAFS